jgi:hypothetical protein
MAKRVLTAALSAFAALAVAGAAFAATVTVTPASLNGWSVVHDTCGAASTGSVSFVNGPASPPAGVGSVRFTIGANGDSYETLRTAAYNGTKLSDLTALDYSSYESQFGTGGQAAYLDLRVDWNNDGVQDDTITFEPIYQTSQGSVTLNTWQHWDALPGLWWSDNLGGPPPWFTLASYITSHPNAMILGGSSPNLILATGCGGAAWTNFVGNADKLTINGTTYDFEPAIGPPTSKEQCKKGGWRQFNNPSFKNQGQCVAYVNHHNGKGNDDNKTHQHNGKGDHGNKTHHHH